MTETLQLSLKKISIARKLIYSLIICILFLGGIEMCLRLTGFRYTPRQRVFYKPQVGMINGTRDYIIPTVFDPPGNIWLMPQSIVGRDASGNKIYEWPVEKKPGAKRICFLGGSTTQPDFMTDYPRRAIALLNNALGEGKYESLNLGMSSYDSHQSLLALNRYGLPRNPDCVVNFDGWNEFGTWLDGYSSKEKSRWMRSPQWVEPTGQVRGRAVDFRLTQLVARLLDVMDRSWPRLNTDFEDFRNNLDAMARTCADRALPFVIVTRPISRGPLPATFFNELRMQYFGKHHQITDPKALYQFLHTQCTNIQAGVAVQHANARLAEACAAVEALQNTLAQNPREGVAAFVQDAMHCTPLGYQAIAEAAALAIAPEEATKIRAYLASGAYELQLAQEFKQMDHPYLCEYAAEQALQKDATLSTEANALRTWAQGQYAFWRLYEANIRHKGPLVPLGKRLDNLGKCLDMRPSDAGVLASIFQAASWNGRTELAVPLLLKFKPANAQDQYMCLRMLFQANAAARNWTETEKVARTLLAMNPADQEAQAFLSALQNATTSSAPRR
jgi:hypothetical protein